MMANQALQLLTVRQLRHPRFERITLTIDLGLISLLFVHRF
jgi:hypothetical protein